MMCFSFLCSKSSVPISFIPVILIVHKIIDADTKRTLFIKLWKLSFTLYNEIVMSEGQVVEK